METRQVSATVWPHNHKDEFRGPHDLRIGIASQPPLLHGWNPKRQPLIDFAQPMSDETNFTAIRLRFNKHETEKPDGCKWATIWFKPMPCPDLNPDKSPEEQVAFREGWRKANPGTLNVYLKAKWTEALPHPIPLGKWEGVLTFDDGEAIFTLQAVSLKVQPTQTKRNILVPGDEEFEHYRRIQKSK